METKRVKPDWFKIKIASGEKFSEINSLMHSFNLHSVCEEALCPNRAECWKQGTATFLIMGDECTRNCRFCSVKTNPSPELPDKKEPEHLAFAVKKLGLKYAVITSVDRDDLTDLGANHFAKCVTEVRKQNPSCRTEVLVPDFQGKKDLIKKVISAEPDVFAHNIEVVKSLQKNCRDNRASYSQSLSVLKTAKEINPNILTKSSLMLGLGETREEILEAMSDLRNVQCDFLTLGQYLQPTKKNLLVQEYLNPVFFNQLKRIALQKGFSGVASGPLVRSSYMAHKLFSDCK